MPSWNEMKVLIFGATGMVGKAVLRECLLDSGVEAVTSIGRTAAAATDAKLSNLIHSDLLDYSAIEPQLTGFDACFFCLGVSAGSVSEEQYRRLTYGITAAAAETLARLNPAMTFIFVSGAGADSTGQSKVMWARTKGKAENTVLGLPFKASYVFRPAAIQPVNGEVSRTTAYRILYAITKPLLPLLLKFFPAYIVTTEELGRAMLRIVRSGYPKRILESADIGDCARR